MSEVKPTDGISVSYDDNLKTKKFYSSGNSFEEFKQSPLSESKLDVDFAIFMHQLNTTHNVHLDYKNDALYVLLDGVNNGKEPENSKIVSVSLPHFEEIIGKLDSGIPNTIAFLISKGVSVTVENAPFTEDHLDTLINFHLKNQSKNN